MASSWGQSLRLDTAGIDLAICPSAIIFLDAVTQHEKRQGETLLDFVQAVAGHELAQENGLGLNAV
jgi:hypothetical protein